MSKHRISIDDDLYSALKSQSRLVFLSNKRRRYRSERLNETLRRLLPRLWATSTEERLAAYIDEAQFGPRICNSLRRHMGIQTLEDLVRHTRDDLRRCKGIGRGSLEEIERKLQELGLFLRYEQ